MFINNLFGKKKHSNESVKNETLEQAPQKDREADHNNTAAPAKMRFESDETWNNDEIYQKSSGYEVMSFDEFKFYYRSEIVEYNALGHKGKSRLNSYGFEHDHDITDSIMIFKNKAGLKALVIYVPIPTFDSSDRIWDSYRKLYLIPDDEGVIGFMVCGGYEIAKIIAYNDIRCANGKTKKLLNNTGIF